MEGTGNNRTSHMCKDNVQKKNRCNESMGGLCTAGSAGVTVGWVTQSSGAFP